MPWPRWFVGDLNPLYVWSRTAEGVAESPPGTLVAARVERVSRRKSTERSAVGMIRVMTMYAKDLSGVDARSLIAWGADPDAERVADASGPVRSPLPAHVQPVARPDRAAPHQAARSRRQRRFYRDRAKRVLDVALVDRLGARHRAADRADGAPGVARRRRALLPPVAHRPRRPRVRHLEDPHHGARRRRPARGPSRRRPRRRARVALDPEAQARPSRHPRRPLPAQDLARRAAAVLERASRARCR